MNVLGFLILMLVLLLIGAELSSIHDILKRILKEMQKK